MKHLTAWNVHEDWQANQLTRNGNQVHLQRRKIPLP